jgi:hypothetical protein
MNGGKRHKPDYRGSGTTQSQHSLFLLSKHR